MDSPYRLTRQSPRVSGVGAPMRLSGLRCSSWSRDGWAAENEKGEACAAGWYEMK